MGPVIQMSVSARLRLPGYLILGFIGAIPFLDLVAVAWPPRLTEVTWRFSTFGQLSAGVAAPLIALLLIYALAYANDDRGVLYLCAVLASVYAILLIAGALTFPLDALQMRGKVAPAVTARFTTASAIAQLRLMGYAIGATVLALSAGRSARMLGALAASPVDPASTLVMKNLGPSRPTPIASETIPAPPEIAG